MIQYGVHLHRGLNVPEIKTSKEETLFLCSTPSMQDKLLAGMNTPLEECKEWIDGEEQCIHGL